MLAQRYIAMCDHAECDAKCRATVTLKTAPVVRGSMQPIALIPVDIKLAEGWSWGWSPKKQETLIGCPDHKVER